MGVRGVAETEVRQERWLWVLLSFPGLRRAQEIKEPTWASAGEETESGPNNVHQQPKVRFRVEASWSRLSAAPSGQGASIQPPLSFLGPGHPTHQHPRWKVSRDEGSAPGRILPQAQARLGQGSGSHGVSG